MTDLHCHALCSVDDGARSVEQMHRMLDIAYNDGIRQICFTPHFKEYHFENDEQILEYKKRIEKSFSLACDYILDKYPNMKLFLGNEIMYHHDIFESLSGKKCSFIANSSYALVEFLPNTSFFEIQASLSNLLRKGVRPILAHAERYVELVKNTDKVASLKEAGVLIQINAGSIVKMKLGKCARFIKSLFKKSLIDIIATDAHNDGDYSPIMSKAVASIRKKYGEGMANRVSSVIPNMILDNKKVH